MSADISMDDIEKEMERRKKKTEDSKEKSEP